MMYNLSAKDVAVLVLTNIAVQDLMNSPSIEEDEHPLDELYALHGSLDLLVTGLDTRRADKQTDIKKPCMPAVQSNA